MERRSTIDRELRIATRCRVEFVRLGHPVVAESEDLSKRGLFVRTDKPLAVGTISQLSIELPTGTTVELKARVAHLLSVSAARALGRQPGMGFEFVGVADEGRHKLIEYIDSLIEETTPPPEELLHTARLVVADPNTPLLVRLTNALEGAAGFEVDSVTNGADAFVACLQSPPDIVCAAADMPFMDGMDLVRKLKGHNRLRDVPVVLMSEDQSDLVRLEAYRLGVADWLVKPFTDEEITIRLRRIVFNLRVPTPSPIQEERTTLQGNLSEISLQTLLSLFEFERKSGILMVLHDSQAARLLISEGRVCQVEGPTDAGTPTERLMSILDWQQGNFEFTATEVAAEDAIGMSTQGLLMEHARIKDEASR